MRLRNVPGAREAIAENKYCVQEPEKYRGNWRAGLFQNDNPLHVEIGMGKGDFIIELAEKHPEINYIGIEKFSSVLFRAVEKMESRSDRLDKTENRYASEDDRIASSATGTKQINNLYFLRFDATELESIFAPGEVDRIYLNFSDPWPKDRHAKRRLTSPQFLEIYNRVLSQEIDTDSVKAGLNSNGTDKSNTFNNMRRGLIQFKTDNRALFDYSVETINESDTWEIRELTYDLHHSDQLAGNVMTEYEKKFVAAGHPICRFVIARSLKDE
ncbi:MAG: tRNA (guanosine(46)-N7)-methyltransferase TrmB [Eubacterium sp.]|nr:tRNA (guanosine(46)-N7)-methyltransferase TrmB [Eubacterium sp.]